MGAIEQHGPVLPLGTDTIIVDRLAAELASRFHLLVGPSVAIAASDNHLGFPGTLSSGKDILVALLQRVCAQLLGRDPLGRKYQKASFDLVFLLTAHAGNIPAFREVAVGNGVEALLGWWELDEVRLTIMSHGMIGGAHADETEISLLLYYERQGDGTSLRGEGFQIGADPGPERPRYEGNFAIRDCRERDSPRVTSVGPLAP